MATQSPLFMTQPGVAGTNRGKKKRLLIAANREEMRRLRAILRPLEIAIDWAADADSANVALDAPGSYDAVIVDDKLPEDGCQEVMEFAAELGVKAPFLVCTNPEGADRFLTESKKVLIVDLLMRPYDNQIVQQRVRNALETDRTGPYPGATVPSHQ